MYTAGPGDIIGTWRQWKEKRDDPGQVAMTYSGQFFDVCRQLGAKGYAIASHPRRERVEDEQFRVEHRPIYFQRGSALRYHFGQTLSAIQMIVRALKFRADAIIVADGTCHWFPLRLLPLLGTQVIPTVHCVLWTKNNPPTGRIRRMLARLDRPLWQNSAAVILSASIDITRQIDQTTSGKRRPVVQFLPTYRPGTFEAVPPPTARTPFRVLFAGRIEAYKGVFDLLEIANRFNVAGQHAIEFDLCGTGSAIESLRQRIAESRLASGFRVHGHCDRAKMRQMFRDCHILIVPTTTDFPEGFNQVVVEGVLAGRPVITSSVCPALDYVREAVIEVPPNDITAYHDAILLLHDDPILYEQKLAASIALQGQFYDFALGWAYALLKSLGHESILTTRAVRSYNPQ
jgi:glycosyltransferase involved in cell wall biosynthesis